jgi:hypothetical protein
VNSGIDQPVRIRRVIGLTGYTPKQTGAEDVGNSTSSAARRSK